MVSVLKPNEFHYKANSEFFSLCKMYVCIPVSIFFRSSLKFLIDVAFFPFLTSRSTQFNPNSGSSIVAKSTHVAERFLSPTVFGHVCFGKDSTESSHQRLTKRLYYWPTLYSCLLHLHKMCMQVQNSQYHHANGNCLLSLCHVCCLQNTTRTEVNSLHWFHSLQNFMAQSCEDLHLFESAVPASLVCS